MTGAQLIDLTGARQRRRHPRPTIVTHPFFRVWARDHRAELRAALRKPSAPVIVGLEQLWKACGFDLHDDVVMWSAVRDGRGFQGEHEPPWLSETQTIALLTRARRWPFRPAVAPEPKPSGAEKRRRDRERIIVQQAIVSGAFRVLTS
jgi:hypothetical protein